MPIRSSQNERGSGLTFYFKSRMHIKNLSGISYEMSEWSHHHCTKACGWKTTVDAPVNFRTTFVILVRK